MSCPACPVLRRIPKTKTAALASREAKAAETLQRTRLAFAHPRVEKAHLFLRVEPMLSAFHDRNARVAAFGKRSDRLKGLQGIAAAVQDLRRHVPCGRMRPDILQIRPRQFLAKIRSDTFLLFEPALCYPRPAQHVQDQPFHIDDGRNEIRPLDQRPNARLHAKIGADAVRNKHDSSVFRFPIRRVFKKFRFCVPRIRRAVVKSNDLRMWKQRPVMRRFRRAAASEEVRAYFVIIGVAVVIITANIYSMYNGLGEALRHAAFQVGSIITTTGFSSCDFDLWPTLSKEILVMLMFVGACAGSTGGGIKVSRLLLMGKTVGKELKQALHPQVVAPVRMDGKVVNHETIRATNVYVAAYIFIFAASFFLISLDDFDMVTNFTAIAATLNNIGPGLAQVGPMMNFGSYSNPAKLVMIFDMLAGRLEIFPMLVFFMPDTWRRF